MKKFNNFDVSLYQIIEKIVIYKILVKDFENNLASDGLSRHCLQFKHLLKFL